VPWGGHSIFLKLKKSIFIYDFIGIGIGFNRDLMTVDTTNYGSSRRLRGRGTSSAYVMVNVIGMGDKHELTESDNLRL
jgi:hypothetical protein